MASMLLSPSSMQSYKAFLAVKRLPMYSFCGRTAVFPDEYADRIGASVSPEHATAMLDMSPQLFDYQSAIVKLALQKRRFSIFADCGLGKTMMFLEYVRHVRSIISESQSILIVSPLMVVSQTLAEAARWYPDMAIERIAAKDLPTWLKSGRGIGITNYDALTDDCERGRLGCLVLDESSMLKSHYGTWAGICLKLGSGVTWKLACTGTPAPNDRIEYANHACFMDAFPTVNAFLAKFFVNRGQTGERWELKPHAIRPFYVALSHWSIFLSDTSVYGWKDNTERLPPIHVHIESVDMTEQQRDAIHTSTGALLVTSGAVGGIAGRSTIAQIAKGNHRGVAIDTNKPQYIASMLSRWPDEQTIIWCRYNAEQDALAAMMPDAGNISGDTPLAERERIIAAFKGGSIRTLITKPKILGSGLNLHMASRQIFSTLQDSYEEYYQAVKRSNRFGATKPLHVHIPMTEIEHPMVENVLRKCKMVDQDTKEQERLFKEIGYAAS